MNEHAKPPLPRQQQPMPGRTEAMRPRPDHGERSYRGSGKLKGKKAVITGGDSGIGRAVAIAFAREGADVLIAYLSEDDDAQETKRLVEDAGASRPRWSRATSARRSRSHAEAGLENVRDLSRQTQKELEKFFAATDEFQEKAISVVGWKGPKQAARLIKDAAKSFKKGS
jgi:NAD(P)-dependent dehydrogenase (short-subunit alcohol dehydrogenase family)